MTAVIIALLPAAGFGIYYFGLNALYLILATVATAVIAEYLACLIGKKKVTTGDYSAVVTGLILALCLPPDMPIWIGVAGAAFAILVVKIPFGGLGRNIVNPAAAARCFLLLSFAPMMIARQNTVLATSILTAGEEGDIAVSLLDLIFGHLGGMIGETSMLALAAGVVFLVLLGVVDLRIPGVYILSFLGFIVLFTKNTDPVYLVAHLIGGGLLLGAFFMATDFVTRPLSVAGQLIYGLLLGFLTAVFRFYGSGMEGVVFAIIIVNFLTPLIDKCISGYRPQKVKNDET
jgi:Na+-translocating ferredoxin:NAD+ oxidoreductase RnfD subunit